MTIYTLIPLAAMWICVFVFAVVFSNNPGSQVNRAFLIYCGCIFLYLLKDFIMWSSLVEIAPLAIVRAGTVTWLCPTFLFLSFVYVLLGRRRDLLYWSLLTCVVMSCILGVFTDQIIYGTGRFYWGVQGLHGRLFPPAIATSVVLPGVVALYMLVREYRRSQDSQTRYQLLFLAAGSAFFFFLVLLLGVLLPSVGIRTLPELGANSAMVQLIFVYIALRKYRLMSIGVSDVADDLFGNTSDGVLIIDSARMVLHANSTSRRILGVGSGMTALASHIPGYDDAASYHDERFEIEQQGQRFVVSLSKSSFETASGQRGDLVLFKDISEQERDVRRRMEAEQQQRQLEEQLHHAQKMEALGTLAGGIAHDMNNLLAAIMAISSAIQQERTGDDPLLEDIRNIIASCIRGRDLTQNLLGFARKGKYVKKLLSINSLVVEVDKILRRTISKKVTIELDLASELMPVLGDPTQLTHALMNVCINATDAMHGAGTLTIATENRCLTSEDVAGQPNLQAGPFAVAVVTDTGEGMDERTLERAFEPFFSTKPREQGSGLGLSMVYGTVVNHGGVVKLASQPGHGTEVTLCLPATEERLLEQKDIEQTDREPARAAAWTRESAARILLVDDEELVLRAGARLLRTLGCQVILACGGEEALSIYEKKRDAIDLVLLDLSMPRLDGADTFSRLRALNPTVRVVFCTGRTEEERAAQLLSAGALGFLQKPYSKESLVETIQQVLPAL